MKDQSKILTWMKETLFSFLAELSLSKSRPTVDAYRYDVGRFLEWLHQRGVKRATSLKGVHVVEYLGYCKEGGKEDASINRYYMAIRSYCRFLRRTKVLAMDISEDVQAPRINVKAPRIPTVKEIELILAQPNTETESGTRDKAILELLYSSALRASELCSLKIEDYAQDAILVRCGKRSKTRTVPITKEAQRALNEYIEQYRGKETGYLFLTIMGKALRRQLLCTIVQHYAKKAGVEEVTTHTLRHACATHLLDQGADLRLIQEILGHSSIASTQRYTHLSSQKMQQMFNQFHPRKSEVHNE